MANYNSGNLYNNSVYYNSQLKFKFKPDFVVDSDSILQPLGLRVLGDSRYELLPQTRDNTEEIPGKHGEIDFGTEFKPRMLEIHVATDEEFAATEKARLKRLFAQYLDPIKGVKTLIFSDEIEKTYYVKYSGKIDISNYPTWFEFTIPFKMSNPFIIGTFEKTLIGSGALANEGTYETPMIIEIAGPAENPSAVVGGQTLAYTGSILEGEVLIIDTGAQTVRLNGNNAIASYNGIFPMLKTGNTDVTANNNIRFSFREYWT